MITKRIHSQDAHYKLSPKNSGETSLNLSNEILQLIAPALTKGSETPISFTLYREDYLKALGAIVNCSPLYITSSSSSTVVSSDPNVFIKDFQAICSFFGPNEKKTYFVNLIYRNDGRIYLNALEDKSSKFNIRHFLLEERSVLEFYKDDNSVTIRLKLDSFEDDVLSQEDVTELIFSEKNLTSFVLSVIQYVNKIDGLNAIVPYASSSSPIKVSKRSIFKLTGMFLESTLDDVKARNLSHTRWFEDQFTLGGRNVFLSTQWNANGDYQLTLDDFIKMIQCCYGTDYIYKTGPNGEHQLFLVSKKANNDLKGYPLQQIFYGAPGTGKSHRIKEIIIEHGLDEKEQVIRTTFHPDSDYSTFVGCYKPIMKSVPQTYVVEGNEKPVMADKDNQATKEEIVYDYTPQAFVQAYTKAWTTDKPVILVIEEINRGNCAQIFGDIFQLLDRGDDGVSEYEIKPDKALENYLEAHFAGKDDVPEDIRNGKIMKLPPNLYIWATMNTSDQSLFPIDSAFKRRWEWKYIKIAWPYKKNEDGSFKTDENGEKVHFNYSIEGNHDWWKFLQQINAIIDKMTNSADKQLGYFFAKAKDDIISYDTFVSKVCFYLWNDIFKTYALDEQQGDLFKFAKKIKDKDEKEKEVIGHLTFPEFYDGDGNVVPDVARQFIEHVMAWNTEGKKENS